MEQQPEDKAAQLYERGLHVFARSVGKETRRLAAECWQEAWELYREQGNSTKASELEILLINLYRRAATAHEDEWQGNDAGVNFVDWGIFFKIGCFGFGGPMAVFSLLEEELVHKRGILTDKDFLEGAVLGDVLPGPVTMDIVTYTGYKLKKWPGAAVSTVVFILPSFIIMLILAILYDKYSLTPRITALLKCLGAAVTGLILSVGLKLTRAEMKDYREVCILVWAFISAMVFKLDILIIVGLAGLVGVVLYYDNSGKQQATE
ncbi:chromate transporter [Verrucomicrobiota bacterium]